MQDAIRSRVFLARLATLTEWSLLRRLWPVGLKIAQLIAGFRRGTHCPAAMAQFERDLKELLDRMGRVIAEWTLNRLEPESRAEMPRVLYWQNEAYRPKRLSPTRNLNCLFGPIRIQRGLYESLDGLRRPALFPLEHALGIVTGVATPALAEVVARLAADFTQRQVLATLLEHHHVRWGVGTLRRVTTAIAGEIAGLQHAARVKQVLAWLKQAAATSGPVRFTLALGRDGVMVPIRGKNAYKEAMTGTLSVIDRWGKRLGTVYLGSMPEAGQGTLSDALTRLLRDVLAQWAGDLPRLLYITDAGFHPREYFENVLCKMFDPRRSNCLLKWEWTVDYYHACTYIGTVAEAIFGPSREAFAWASKMRHWLRDKPGGIHRVLHSAGALRAIRGLVGADKDYQTGCAYLRKHAAWMNYAKWRRCRMPIGSGVTEAACKIVFSQRFKCSGMKWDIAGGAVILELRLAVLSGTWTAVRDAMYASQALTIPRTHAQIHEISLKNAA